MYLADFGLSRVMSSTRAMGTRTLQAGTPGFQAPELLKAVDIDERADIYAFGVTIIELFGERPVWEGLNHFQILCKVAVENELPSYSHLLQAMQQVCAMCIAQKQCRLSISLILETLIALAK